MNDMSQEQNIPRSEIEQAPTTSNRIKAADKTVTSRLESFTSAIKKGVSKQLLLRASILSTVLFPSDNIQNPNVHAPNISEPTPVSAPLPDFTQNYGLETIQTPMPIGSAENIPTPSPTETPTPVLSPVPPLEPAPTNIPSAPETPTPTATMPPSSTQEVTPTPSQTPQQEQAERKELIPYSPSITIVDAAPSVPTEGLIQKEFVSNEDMIRQMLGDKYISTDQLIQEFGLDYADKWDEVVEKYPQALVYRLANTYFSHGEKVARVAEDTLERSGLQSTGINILPLQKIFDKDSIKLIKDSSGNPGISLNFDPKRIIKLLEGDPNRIINASFQVGNVELFQETRKYASINAEYIDSEGSIRLFSSSNDTRHTFPIDETYIDDKGNEVPLKLKEEPKIKEGKSTSLSIVGAYTKEKAMENLPKLFEVCNAYPDKFFVFAGGNGGEDFREAMETLKDQVPKNLIIIAQWIKGNFSGFEYEGPPLYSYDGKFHGGVYGPDIYVNNSELGSPGGSSFSVPIISPEIDVLLKKGLSFEQVKEKILASSDVHTKTLADGTEVTLKVFNPSEMQEK